VMIDQPTALQKLQSGQFDAIARVTPKPIDFFAKIPIDSGLHLVNIPFTKTFEEFYTLGEFTSRDYPNLLQGQDYIDTTAVPAVLAVFNWQKNSGRYNKVERFIQRLFTRWDTFQHPPYHPKWRDVNLAATVPGWTRFSVAERCCRRPRRSSKTGSSEPTSISSRVAKEKRRWLMRIEKNCSDLSSMAGARAPLGRCSKRPALPRFGQ
jgi:hypothetical protein